MTSCVLRTVKKVIQIGERSSNQMCHVHRLGPMSHFLKFNVAVAAMLDFQDINFAHQIPSGPVRIGTTHVQPVSSTRDLDADMSMRTHVTAVVTALCQIRSVRRSLPRHALLTLVRALIVSKVDYCNSVLAGISGQLQDRLQSVLNAAARLVFSARRSRAYAGGG